MRVVLRVVAWIWIVLSIVGGIYGVVLSLFSFDPVTGIVTFDPVKGIFSLG